MAMTLKWKFNSLNGRILFHENQDQKRPTSYKMLKFSLQFFLLLHNSSWVLPSGHTVNKEYYIAVMCCLRESIKKKRPES